MVCWKFFKFSFRLIRLSLNCLINNFFNLLKSVFRFGKFFEKVLILFVFNFLFWFNVKKLILLFKLRIIE